MKQQQGGEADGRVDSSSATYPLFSYTPQELPLVCILPGCVREARQGARTWQEQPPGQRNQSSVQGTGASRWLHRARESVLAANPSWHQSLFPSAILGCQLKGTSGAKWLPKGASVWLPGTGRGDSISPHPPTHTHTYTPETSQTGFPWPEYHSGLLCSSPWQPGDLWGPPRTKPFWCQRVLLALLPAGANQLVFATLSHCQVTFSEPARPRPWTQLLPLNCFSPFLVVSVWQPGLLPSLFQPIKRPGIPLSTSPSSKPPTCFDPMGSILLSVPLPTLLGPPLII